MAKREFTKEQLSAIETRDRTLLVSAAAGSGKTATLIERIIRSVTDAENPEKITDMLIVTFTNAAVEELRTRVSDALKAKLAEEPENKRIEEELYSLPSAKILTIDAFCNDILKNNTERFGISPRYRIADPTEAVLLSHSVFTALIEAAYNGELSDACTAEEFEELTSSLSGVKNSSALEEVFEFLYEKSKSHEDGVKIFENFARRLDEYGNLPIDENPYVKYAISRTKEMVSHFSGFNSKLIFSLGDDERFLEFAQKIGVLLNEILNAQGYNEIKALITNAGLPTIPTVRGEKTPEQLLMRELRDNIKKELFEKCASKYFSYTEDEWRIHIKRLAELGNTLAKFIKKFDSVFFEEKKKRAILEYSDVERLAFLSLYEPDGSLSELALSLKNEFSSVYIDEYQDVNALQNKIFLALSRDDNRFAVGDIKQSIYGFRSARPDIFAEMKESFPPLESSNPSESASIFMSNNFRSDEGIIDFANDIFDKMFALRPEAIGYDSKEKLIFSKKYNHPVPQYRAPKVHLFTKGDANSDADSDENAAETCCPRWVAEKIKWLLENGTLDSGKPVAPSDIAIILRKDGGRSKLYADALEAAGIKAHAPDSVDFFLNSEIQLMLCLLNAINNPMRDIYLAGLMLSPLFNFTPDELYLARRLGGLSLWNSVNSYSEANPENEKFLSFIRTVNRYRTVSEGMQADSLILRLYNETGILALAAKNGSKENLMLLYDYARKFEASSFEGLYNFINYVNAQIESGATFSSKKEDGSDDAVTIMTVHKSKGLEFPIVFLADASSSLISRNEQSPKVAYSEEMGIGIKIRREGGIALLESPVYNAVVDRNIEKSIEEELRVYYVALTRAREELYVTAALNSASKEKYLSAAASRRLYTSPYSLRELKSFVDIMFLCDTRAEITWEEDSDSEASSPEACTPTPTDLNEESHTEKASLEDAKLRELLCDRFSYSYPKIHLTKLPEKMSISKLYPTVLDGEEDAVSPTLDDTRVKKDSKSPSPLPKFITGSSEYESAKCGIATHSFLQFFNVDAFIKDGAKAELSRLVREEFISEEDKERVRIDEIELFKKSALLQKMRCAKKLYREFRFSVMLPAELFTEDPEKKAAVSGKEILLQGVIDCIIENEDGSLALIDYKTDRLTKEELSDKALAKATLVAKHSLQLSYYALAIEKIFGKYPDSVQIYSLMLGDTVDVLSD